jgi:hypothetical protein
MKSDLLNRILRQGLVVIAISAIFLFVATSLVFAQTTPPEGKTQAQIDAALQDLSALYGSPVVRIDQAKAICNDEQYFLACGEIGRKHNLFDADRALQVDSLITEFKGSVVQQIEQCSNVDCLVEVATSIAKELSSKNPTLASATNLTTSQVEEKQAIVSTARELGIDFEQCRTMDPETASVELLRSCARLAKDSRIQNSIPENSKNSGVKNDATIDLKEALINGELQCGDGTIEGCGNFCLNPSSEDRGNGANAIPQVCRQIAERFFGNEGVRELESSYASVQQAVVLTKQNPSAVFTTEDGRKLTNPAAIGRYLEDAGQRGDVVAIENGMSFMVANGFAKPSDKDFALKMVQKIQERGSINFDQCRTNPEACNEFVPDDERVQFAAMGDVEKIMRQEMTSRGIDDPSRCQFDSSLAEACMASARASLPQIEQLAVQSPQLNSIVSDIRQKIRFGEESVSARQRAQDRIQSGTFVVSGQQFKSFSDLENFCSIRPQECLAEAARTGVFARDVATEKYQSYVDKQFDQYTSPPNIQNTQTTSGTLPATGQQFNPQTQGYTSADKQAALKQFESWLDNPQGPPPVPPGTRNFNPYPYVNPGQQTTSFPRYQGQVGTSTQYSQYYPPYSCPQVVPRPCPAGEYRQESKDLSGCYVFGACIPFATKTQQENNDNKRATCPALSTVSSCPAGQERIVEYSSPDCGTYYSCRAVSQPQSGVKFPYTFINGKRVSSLTEARAYCQQNGPGSGQGISNECIQKLGVIYNSAQPDPLNTTTGVVCEKYGSGWHSMDSSGNCFNPAMTDYRTPGGTLQQCSKVSVYGCSNSTYPTYDQPLQGQKQQIWNNFGLQSLIRVDADPARIASLKTACANVQSSANVWNSGAGNPSDIDFGMPDLQKCKNAALCTSGQYYDGIKCTDSSAPPQYSSSAPAEVTKIIPAAHEHWSDADTKTYMGGDEDTYVVYDFSTKSIKRQGKCSTDPNPPKGCDSASPGPSTTNDCRNNYSTSSCTAQPGCKWFLGSGGAEYCDGDNYIPPTSTANDCRNNYSTSSCTAQPGCKWFLGTGGAEYCEGDNFIPPTSTTQTSSAGAPFAPTGLTTSIKGTSIYMAWSNTANSETAVTKLKIWRKDPGGQWAVITEIPTDDKYIPSPSYTDDNAPQVGTITYQVQACNNNGCSPDSNQSTILINRPQCSDFKDNDGDGWIDYPRDNGCLSEEDNDEVYEPPRPTTQNTTYKGDESSCPGFAYSKWDNKGLRYCQLNSEYRCDYNYPSYLTNGENYSGEKCPSDLIYNTTPTNTTPTNTSVSGSCSSELIGLLGDACHSMGNAWFNGPMTQYVMPNTTTVKNCSTTWVSGCSGGSSSSTGSSSQCPAGYHFEYNEGSSVVCFSDASHDQYRVDGGPIGSCSDTWRDGCTSGGGSGSGDYGYCGNYSDQNACTSATNCYWQSGSPSYCYYDSSGGSSQSCSSDQYWNGSACASSQTACAEAGGTWSTSSNYCQMPNTQSCSSTQYWNGSACVDNSSSSQPSSSSCPSDQYWNGSACAPNPSSADPSQACGESGGTWDSASNYCNMPSAFAPAKLAKSEFCPSGHVWNGSICFVTHKTNQNAFVASVLQAILSLFNFAR